MLWEVCVAPGPPEQEGEQLAGPWHLKRLATLQPVSGRGFCVSPSSGTALSSQESTLSVDLDFKQPFLELNRILEALHQQDLGPALE